jgi:hypothetical protein
VFETPADVLIEDNLSWEVPIGFCLYPIRIPYSLSGFDEKRGESALSSRTEREDATWFALLHRVYGNGEMHDRLAAQTEI